MLKSWKFLNGQEWDRRQLSKNEELVHGESQSSKKNHDVKWALASPRKKDMLWWGHRGQALEQRCILRLACMLSFFFFKLSQHLHTVMKKIILIYDFGRKVRLSGSLRLYSYIFDTSLSPFSLPHSPQCPIMPNTLLCPYNICYLFLTCPLVSL